MTTAPADRPRAGTAVGCRSTRTCTTRRAARCRQNASKPSSYAHRGQDPAESLRLRLIVPRDHQRRILGIGYSINAFGVGRVEELHEEGQRPALEDPLAVEAEVELEI